MNLNHLITCGSGTRTHIKYRSLQFCRDWFRVCKVDQINNIGFGGWNENPRIASNVAPRSLWEQKRFAVANQLNSYILLFNLQQSRSWAVRHSGKEAKKVTALASLRRYQNKGIVLSIYLLSVKSLSSFLLPIHYSPKKSFTEHGDGYWTSA